MQGERTGRQAPPSLRTVARGNETPMNSHERRGGPRKKMVRNMYQMQPFAVLESGHAHRQGGPLYPVIGGHWRAGLLVRTLRPPARVFFSRGARMASKGFRSRP
jgi:hypothetical protein